MISREESNKLKLILPNNWIKEISVVLKDKKITNSKGQFHSKYYLSRVMNGVKEDVVVEAIIFDYANNISEKLKTLAQAKSTFNQNIQELNSNL